MKMFELKLEKQTESNMKILAMKLEKQADSNMKMLELKLRKQADSDKHKSEKQADSDKLRVQNQYFIEMEKAKVEQFKASTGMLTPFVGMFILGMFTLQATMVIRDSMTGSTGPQQLGFLKEKTKRFILCYEVFL